ncbi:MAG: hypothetical protein Q9211_003056 [Gyalolechia sp. 1 TL-2023]
MEHSSKITGQGEEEQAYHFTGKDIPRELGILRRLVKKAAGQGEMILSVQERNMVRMHALIVGIQKEEQAKDRLVKQLNTTLKTKNIGLRAMETRIQGLKALNDIMKTQVGSLKARYDTAETQVEKLKNQNKKLMSRLARKEAHSLTHEVAYYKGWCNSRELANDINIPEFIPKDCELLKDRDCTDGELLEDTNN